MPAQPSDEWTYLRPEEFADDDAVERVDAFMATSAEDAALHVVDLDEPPSAGTALDPGETLGRSESGDGAAMTDQYFDDEEPESDRPAAPVVVDDGQEPSVDDILTSQHYSFEQEPS